MTEKTPQVGIGLIVTSGNKILLGRRRGSHGSGEYAGPGGHLEYAESITSSIMREVLEEAGPDFKIKNLRMLCVSNVVEYLPKHYLDIGMIADWHSGEAQVMEPNKLESWGWYSLDNLPEPLFKGTDNYLKAMRTNSNFFDSQP